MTHADAFVGMVAIGLGSLGLAAAIRNWDGCYQNRKSRLFEQLGGRTAARLAYCLVGVGLIVLGFAIARGFAPNRAQILFRNVRPAFATPPP